LGGSKAYFSIVLKNIFGLIFSRLRIFLEAAREFNEAQIPRGAWVVQSGFQSPFLAVSITKIRIIAVTKSMGCQAPLLKWIGAIGLNKIAITPISQTQVVLFALCEKYPM